MDFKDTFYNFSGIEFQVWLDTLYCNRELWWHETAEKMFIVWFNITSESDSNFWVEIEFSDFQRGWGSSWGRKTAISCSLNHTEGFGGFYFPTLYNYDLSPDSVLFDLYFNRTTNKLDALFYL